MKYQLATESVTISKAPSDLSDLKDETLKLIQIDNSASYGTSNPDYGILAVTMKSSYNTTRKRRSTTTTDLFTEVTLVNSDLKPVAKLASDVAAETKSFGCPSSNSSTVSAASSSFVFLAYLASSFSSTVELTVNLDFTEIGMGNMITSELDASQREVLHMFEVTPDHISYRKSIEVIVESGNDINGTLYVSPSCHAASSDVFEGVERSKLTFSRQGRFSLHETSFPKIKSQR